MKNYKKNFNTIIVYLFFIQQFCCNLNEHITEDEVKSAFPFINTNEKIPQYELTKISIETPKRNSNNDDIKLKFVAFGRIKTIKLSLHKSSIIGNHTQIHILSNSGKKNIITSLPPDTLAKTVKFYKSSKGSIIGSGTREDGHNFFSGHIGNLAIYPATSNLSRKKRDILQNKLLIQNKNTSNNYILTDYHIIFNNLKYNSSIEIETKNLLNKLKYTKFNNNWIRKKRDIFGNNNIIYPELLVLADYKKTFHTIRSVIRNGFLIYLIAFWNNVALSFKTLINPVISIRITGIVINSNSTAMSFLYNNISPGGRVFDNEAIRDMYIWLINNKKIFPRETYDIAITMTRKNLCERNKLGYCGQNTIGVANFNANCSWNNSDGGMFSIIHDDYNFNGIWTAVHEIAHIFGANHDGDESLHIRECNPNDVLPNYIMYSEDDDVYDNYIWSNCSRKAISISLRRGRNTTKRCFTVNSTLHTGAPINSILPGELTTLSIQCKERGYEDACYISYNICKNLQCWNDNDSNCTETGPPLDGSFCNFNKHCILGNCVHYTH